jgi:endonuclease YncB( thermonuclease family)
MKPQQSRTARTAEAVKRFPLKLILPLITVLSLQPDFAIGTDFTGPVISVLDGDTIEVLHNTWAERIRLSGIDCPETGQAYGKRAKQAASELVLGGEVTLQTYGHDKYGHTLADVLLLDGTNVNHTLVEDGWCWWYRKYAPGDAALEGLEKEAREARLGLGLWADPNLFDCDVLTATGFRQNDRSSR